MPKTSLEEEALAALDALGGRAALEALVEELGKHRTTALRIFRRLAAAGRVTEQREESEAGRKRWVFSLPEEPAGKKE